MQLTAPTRGVIVRERSSEYGTKPHKTKAVTKRRVWKWDWGERQSTRRVPTERSEVEG
jgi:hypothetical protein